MPDATTIVQRIAKCEEEIDQLKAEWQGIPDLIEARLRLTDSRVARLQSEMTGVKGDITGLKRDIADLKGGVAELKGGVAELKGGIDALPRVLAEMLDERERRR